MESLEALGNAYELAILPPQILMDDPSIDPVAVQELEKLSDETSFQLLRTAGPEIEVLASSGQTPLGRITFHLTPKRDGKFVIAAEPHDDSDELQKLARHCRRDDWLRIWFDSEHTYSAGGVFQVRFRDYPFDNIQYHDFANFRVARLRRWRDGSCRLYPS